MLEKSAQDSLYREKAIDIFIYLYIMLIIHVGLQRIIKHVLLTCGFSENKFS